MLWITCEETFSSFRLSLVTKNGKILKIFTKISKNPEKNPDFVTKPIKIHKALKLLISLWCMGLTKDYKYMFVWVENQNLNILPPYTGMSYTDSMSQGCSCHAIKSPGV